MRRGQSVCEHMKVKVLGCVWLFAIPGTVGRQAPPAMGFSRQEYWSGLPFPPQGGLPDPGIELRSPALQADPLSSEPTHECVLKQTEFKSIHQETSGSGF